MSEIDQMFAKNIKDSMKKELLSILRGEKTSEVFSMWMFEYGSDHHEFVIAGLMAMDEDESTDSEEFKLIRLAGKRERWLKLFVCDRKPSHDLSA